MEPDGIAIGTVRGGTVEFSCRGMVSGGPVGPDTVMYGASVTKQFVGFLLALGVEAGRASPDDGIRRWLPELPGWTDEVRLQHLLHHTSGLPDLAEPSPGIPASNDGTAGPLPAVGRTAAHRTGQALRVQQRRLRPARRGGEPDHGPDDRRAGPRAAVRAARHGGDPAGRREPAHRWEPGPAGHGRRRRPLDHGGRPHDLVVGHERPGDRLRRRAARPAGRSPGRRHRAGLRLGDPGRRDAVRAPDQPRGNVGQLAGQDGPLPGEGRRRRRPEHRRHGGRDQPAGRRPGHPVGGASGWSSANSHPGGSAGPRIVEDVR